MQAGKIGLTQFFLWIAVVQQVVPGVVDAASDLSS
jgi:hypothetical protein